MKKHNLAFIDVETTGFNPDMHEVIELGCVVARQTSEPGQSGAKLEIIHEIEYKIKPENLAVAEPSALRINGYNEADWLFALSLDQAMKDLAPKVEGATFVAHNVTFDWNFVTQAFRKANVPNTMHYGKLDTLSMAFAILYREDRLQSFKLESLAEFFGVQNPKAHTALSDARATFEIYRRLLKIQP